MKKTYPNLTIISNSNALLNAFKKHLFFIFAFFALTTQSFSQTTVTITATGAGTFTPPCGVTSITVEAWGAGGGGQRANGNPSAGGGGSGGGYVRTTYTVVPNTSYNLFVGTGGTGNSGGNGTASWFNNSSTISAVGGRGAGSAVTADNSFGTGAAAFTTGNIGGTIISTYGGNGGNAGNNFSGGGGSSAGNVTGNNASGTTGGTAPANGYAGANGRSNNGTSAGGNIGAGGAGGRTGNDNDRNGGAGGDGQIKITYTSPLATYCTTNFASGVEAITNVTFAGINNTTLTGTSGGVHEIFCDEGNVVAGSSYPISVNGDTDGPYYDYIRVFFDWNQDGDFTDTGEDYDIGTIYNNNGTGTPATSTIAVPFGASLGKTRMRVLKRYNSYGAACNTFSFGQTEDYVINVAAPPACVTPTAQPTALSLTPALTTITGSFTAASPAPNSYLVVVSASATPPTLTNGTTYTIGGTVGTGYTVVDTDSNTTFTATGLLSSTLYYVYVFSYNNLCSGGPRYLTTSPLTGSTTTLAASYCTPTSEGPQYVYITTFVLWEH